VISGYSMGGLGSFNLGDTYPEDFSEAMPLDGLLDDACVADRAANARWEPFVISNAEIDELSPYPLAAAEAAEFEAAGNRFDLFTTSLPEHNATAASDGFSTQIAALGGTPEATADPGTISYTWCPAVVDRTLGLGPTNVYWLSGLSERSASSSSSEIVADDGAIPTPPETEQTSAAVINPPDAPPMIRLTGSWAPGVSPPATDTLTLRLTNVASLTVDTAAAKLPRGVATVTTDGSTTLTLTGLEPGTPVIEGGSRFAADAAGTIALHVAAGTTPISW
jgi:hypothetical protein